MTYYDVYIGDINDPTFNWEKGNPHGNVPHRESPFFPPPAPFALVIEKIGRGLVDGKQTDWGGWTVRATGKYLKDFVHTYYSGPNGRYGNSLAHLEARLAEL